jgi:hypothetical protein
MKRGFTVLLLALLLALPLVPGAAWAASKSIRVSKQCRDPKSFGWLPFRDGEQFHFAVTWKNQAKTILAVGVCENAVGDSVTVFTAFRSGGSLTMTGSTLNAVACVVGFCSPDGAVPIVFELITGQGDPSLRPTANSFDDQAASARGHLARVDSPAELRKATAEVARFLDD